MHQPVQQPDPGATPLPRARPAALHAALACIAALGLASHAAAATRFVGPTSSQPLALTADNAFLVVANPDNNSVSFFDLRRDANVKVAEVAVQREPNGAVFMPDGSKAYAANTVSGTVSVIPTPNIAGGVAGPVSKRIKVGTEPYGLALTPNGRKLYVTNARSNSVSVIDTATDTLVKTIVGVGFEPRGLAITNDGDADDDDETVYVTQFLSVGSKQDGQDDAKQGHVTVLSTATDALVADVVINPLDDTGFRALGDAIARIPPGDPTVPANFRFVTGAYPNQLNNIAIKGNFAFVPNTGASPNGPVRFDVNTQSLLSVIDRGTNADARRTINMHVAVRDQPAVPKTFVTLPWAIAFKRVANEGYVISAASNLVVKLAIDPATGAATVQRDPGAPDRVLQIPVGKNPRGIVVSSNDRRAYVANHVSRDVTVINLATSPETVLAASLPSAALPTPGTRAARIHIGKELYNTSLGVFDPAPGTTTPITRRMSAAGWGSCSACHTPFGTTDNVVWLFGSGPRRTISQHTDFDASVADRSQMRVLNWLAERDEQEDFELNIRNVSGGLGLIVLADGITPDPAVFNLTPSASGNRNQLRVQGVKAWDAIRTYVQFGIRAPLSPVSKTDPDVVAGRALFISANCQSCHGTAQWTTSRIDFSQPAPPPPAPGDIVGGQLVGQLRQVGTFDPTALNEVTAAGAPALGANGFVPPSLLSIGASQRTFLHNGSAFSLKQLLNLVPHRSAGTGGVDTLSSDLDRERLVKFLRSIDARTVPIAP